MIIEQPIKTGIARGIASGIYNDTGGAAPPAGATLAFHALTPDATTYEMLGVETGTGDLTTTHTADLYAQDSSGVWRKFGANEAVWSEGRVVKNFATRSEDHANWSYVSCTNEGIVSGIGPNGEDAVEVSWPSPGTGRVRLTAFSTTAGLPASGTYVQTWLVRAVSGTSEFRLRMQGNYSNAITVGTSWTLVTMSRTGSSTLATDTQTSLYSAAGQTNNLYIVRRQLDWFPDATDVPSEYVPSLGALEANIGTATFASTNGNTVTSNVVTEAVGTPLAESPYLQYYPAATNSQIYSNDLTNAEWTASNVTVAQDETGITGEPSTACTLTATAGNGTVIANAITDAADDQATCWYLKRKTGTGNIDLTLDNGSTWTTVTLTSEFQKFTVDYTGSPLLANPQIGIRIVTSGDAVICGNAEAYLGGTESEVRGLGPIFCEASSVATDKTSYSFDIANNNAIGSAWFLEWSYSGSTISSYQKVLSTRTSSGQFYTSTSGLPQRMRTADGSGGLSEYTDASTLLENRKLKMGISHYSTETFALNVDGTWAGQSANAQVYPETANAINIHSGTFNAAGIIRNIQRYDITSYQQGKDKIDELMA